MSALLNNIILIVGDHLGYSYVELAVVCYLLTGTLAYAFHSSFTFRRVYRLSSYITFMAGLFLGLPISIALLFVLCTIMQMPMWLAGPLLTIIMVVYNYVSARFAMTGKIQG